MNQSNCQHESLKRNALTGAGARLIRPLLVTMATVMVLAACATTTGGGSSSVVDRAEKRWTALIAGDFQSAYDYYSPGFRSSRSLGDFELSMRLRKVQVAGVEYVDHQCEAERCTVNFLARYKVASPVPGIEVWEGKSSLEERWIRTDGEWWFLPDD